MTNDSSQESDDHDRKEHPNPNAWVEKKVCRHLLWLLVCLSSLSMLMSSNFVKECPDETRKPTTSAKRQQRRQRRIIVTHNSWDTCCLRVVYAIVYAIVMCLPVVVGSSFSWLLLEPVLGHPNHEWLRWGQFFRKGFSKNESSCPRIGRSWSGWRIPWKRSTKTSMSIRGSFHDFDQQTSRVERIL